ALALAVHWLAETEQQARAEEPLDATGLLETLLRNAPPWYSGFSAEEPVPAAELMEACRAAGEDAAPTARGAAAAGARDPGRLRPGPVLPGLVLARLVRPAPVRRLSSCRRAAAAPAPRSAPPPRAPARRPRGTGARNPDQRAAGAARS